MRKVHLLLIVAMYFGGAVAAQAGGDIAAGKKLSSECTGCHGRSGKSTNPRNPNLAGQKEYYLMKSLKAYRDGGRKDATMSSFAKGLSDDDIANLAAYFSRVK